MGIYIGTFDQISFFNPARRFLSFLSLNGVVGFRKSVLGKVELGFGGHL